MLRHLGNHNVHCSVGLAKTYNLDHMVNARRMVGEASSVCVVASLVRRLTHQQLSGSP
jgi:hypothetical protein